MSTDKIEVYVAITEGPGQEPIILESEGPHTTLSEARARAIKFAGAKGSRWAVCSLKFETGNRLLFHDLARMQEPERAPDPEALKKDFY